MRGWNCGGFIIGMKIVVWKSPRILRGLLRSIFGIRE